jgi:hypothetical protein
VTAAGFEALAICTSNKVYVLIQKSMNAAQDSALWELLPSLTIEESGLTGMSWLSNGAILLVSDSIYINCKSIDLNSLLISRRGRFNDHNPVLLKLYIMAGQFEMVEYILCLIYALIEACYSTNSSECYATPIPIWLLLNYTVELHESPKKDFDDEIFEEDRFYKLSKAKADFLVEQIPGFNFEHMNSEEKKDLVAFIKVFSEVS